MRAPEGESDDKGSWCLDRRRLRLGADRLPEGMFEVIRSETSADLSKCTSACWSNKNHGHALRVDDTRLVALASPTSERVGFWTTLTLYSPSSATGRRPASRSRRPAWASVGETSLSFWRMTGHLWSLDQAATLGVSSLRPVGTRPWPSRRPSCRIPPLVAPTRSDQRREWVSLLGRRSSRY